MYSTMLVADTLLLVGDARPSHLARRGGARNQGLGWEEVHTQLAHQEKSFQRVEDYRRRRPLPGNDNEGPLFALN